MNNDRIYDFNDSIKNGNRIEAVIARNYPNLEQLDGRQADLRSRNTGHTLEIKSEIYFSYNPHLSRTDPANKQTPYYYVERVSNDKKGTPGGPWQSASKSDPVTYFCQAFVKNNFWDTYDLNEFLDRTNEYIARHNPPTKTVKNYARNKTHVATSTGYCIPVSWYDSIRKKRLPIDPELPVILD